MDRRVLATGIAVLLVGGVLLAVPAGQGPTSSVEIPNATSVDVYVSGTTSLLGFPVDLELGWGVLATPCYGGSNCMGHQPRIYSLEVFDCGGSTCSSTGNYSFVWGDHFVGTDGTANLSVPVGHHFAVWGWASQLASNGTESNTSVPLRYSVIGPVLGSALGIGFIAAGVAIGVLAFRRPKRPFDPDTDLEYAAGGTIADTESQ